MTPVLGEATRRAANTFNINRIGMTEPAFSGVNGMITHIEGQMTAAGVRIDEKGALRVAAVWIATTLLADEVSSISWRMLRRGDATRHPVEPPQLQPVWGDPNSDQTQQGIIATETFSLVLSGAVYEMLGWNRAGKLDVRWPIDPAQATLTRPEPGALHLKVTGQGELDNRPGELPQFMFIPRYTLPGRLDPVSPVRVAAELAGLSLAYDRTAARLTGKGFSPSAVVTVGEKVDEDVAEELSERLGRLHSGSNSGGVAVLGGKDLSVQAYQMSMVDAQFVAQQDRVFQILMAMWRVPPTVAGMVDKPSTWGTGIAEFSRGLERFTLRPIVELLQSGYERYMLRPLAPDLQWRGRFDSLLSASPAERSQIQRLNLQGGMTSMERVLAQNDEPPFEDDETVYTPLNLADAQGRRLDQLKKAADAAASLQAAGVAKDAAFAAAGINADGTVAGA